MERRVCLRCSYTQFEMALRIMTEGTERGCDQDLKHSADTRYVMKISLSPTNPSVEWPQQVLPSDKELTTSKFHATTESKKKKNIDIPLLNYNLVLQLDSVPRLSWGVKVGRRLWLWKTNDLPAPETLQIACNPSLGSLAVELQSSLPTQHSLQTPDNALLSHLSLSVTLKRADVTLPSSEQSVYFQSSFKINYSTLENKPHVYSCFVSAFWTKFTEIILFKYQP